MKFVYGTKKCSKCKVLVDKLTKEKVDFKYVDIGNYSNKELIELSNEAGQTSLPIVIER